MPKLVCVNCNKIFCPSSCVLCPRGRHFFGLAYNFFTLFGRDSAPYENTSAPLKMESAPDENNPRATVSNHDY